MWPKHSFSYFKDERDLNPAAFDVFRQQYRRNTIYKQFCNLLGVLNPKDITTLNDIPFLPISFFKKHVILRNSYIPERYFESSGTGGMRSKHYYHDVVFYRIYFLNIFKRFYGAPSQWTILSLLPSYSDNPNSSLLYMVKELSDLSAYAESGFYHGKESLLYEQLCKLSVQNKPTMLIGVSFALLDFVERYQIDFPQLTVIETGGMKGRRREMIREELHAYLKSGFNVPHIHSEYGMTELFSQAYAQKDGIFKCPPWMKVMVRDLDAPQTILPPNKSGALNIIDLANAHSCAFIATEDLGCVFEDGSFTVTGRMDNSENRGCNLLLS